MIRRALPAVGLALTLLCALPAARADIGRDIGWDVDLTAITAESSNVTVADGVVRLGPGAARAASAGSPERIGIAVFPAHRLAAPADRVTATADAPVDVRARKADGTWTEWTEAPAGVPTELGVMSIELQVRVVLDQHTPALSALALVPGTSGTTDDPNAVAASFRVFATREGLVGGTTANGHVITERDHFVALPSRRGLAGKTNGTYTVRVCADSGRCEWAPVWDVGPWNTKDDHWSTSTLRQMWQDLPQGKPQAQAAHEDGYNGGKDQFGRTPSNPAGIDLADGTFWDGLKLKGNSWVTVTYQWTGSGPVGTVQTPGDTLNVRTGPSSTTPQVGLAAHLAQLSVQCQAAGEVVEDDPTWYRLAPDMFVAAAFVTGVSSAPSCG